MATLHVKVVPNSKRDRIVGRYGDAVKVHVSAPPEAGRANEALLQVLAAAMGLRSGQLRILRGHGQPRKVVEVDGMDQSTLDERLARHLGA